MRSGGNTHRVIAPAQIKKPIPLDWRQAGKTSIPLRHEAG